MTGAYLRVKRNDSWENIEVEHLTDEERNELFIQRTPEELVKWMNLLCKEVAVIDNFLKESSSQEEE